MGNYFMRSSNQTMGWEFGMFLFIQHTASASMWVSIHAYILLIDVYSRGSEPGEELDLLEERGESLH